MWGVCTEIVPRGIVFGTSEGRNLTFRLPAKAFLPFYLFTLLPLFMSIQVLDDSLQGNVFNRNTRLHLHL